MKLKYLYLFIFLTIMDSDTSTAQWKIGSYSVNFETRNAGFQVDGTISGMNLEVNPPNNVNPDFKIKGSVNVNTLSTQNRTRDHHLMKEEYFDVIHYPQIGMESLSIKKMNADLYQGSFKIQIKNYSKTIQFPFRFKVDDSGNQARLSGEFHINRRDFHVGGYSLILSDSIKVKIQAQIIKS